MDIFGSHAKASEGVAPSVLALQLTKMARPYYSRRTKPGQLTLDAFYWKFRNLYLLFRDRDFFREKAGITELDVPKEVTYDAAIAFDFQPFPVTKWAADEITEDHIFDMIEFLFDRTSKPSNWGPKRTPDGDEYYDYESYDAQAGQDEFRSHANIILADYKTGFELTKEGIILAQGADGLEQILNADIIPYDETHVDSKVRQAIQKWRNRNLSLAEKKQAIRELADVFEWLKKTKNLSTVLDGKDESAIFELANKFAIRHHNPSQKSNYDPVIWYSWMFHFYLATYHASIHLLKRKEAKTKPRSA
jgi:hypothetical protein